MATQMPMSFVFICFNSTINIEMNVCIFGEVSFEQTDPLGGLTYLPDHKQRD